MRLTRSAGVSKEAVPVRRGHIRRKVEVVKGAAPAENKPVVLGMDFGDGDSTSGFALAASTAVRNLIGAGQVLRSMSSTLAQVEQERRRMEVVTQVREMLVEGNPIASVPYEMIHHDTPGMIGRHSTQIINEVNWDRYVGPVQHGFRRHVDHDIRTRCFLIYDHPEPGLRLSFAVSFDALMDRFGRLPHDINEARRLDWSFLRVPAGMELIRVSQDPRRIELELIFGMPHPRETAVFRVDPTFRDV